MNPAQDEHLLEEETKEIIVKTNEDGVEIKTDPEDSATYKSLEIETDTKKFEESPLRFAVCVCYCLLNFGNAMQWVTYSSTANRFGTNFGLSRIQVDMFSLIFMITYPIGCIPEAYIIDNISVRLGLSIASATTFIGAGLKVLTNNHIAWAYLGQILASSFQPAILNSPAKIASVWFRDEKRALVTVICCGSNVVGVLFGYIYHTFFISPEAVDQGYRDQFFNYALWEFILEVILCLPIMFMPSKPEVAVSNSQHNYVSPPLIESLKLLFKNSAFRCMVICSTCLMGFVNIYSTILNPYMAMYGVSDENASYSAATANGLGILSALVISTFLDKSKQFKLYLLVLNLFAIIFFTLLTILLEVTTDSHFVILIIVYSLIICCAIPMASNGMDYVCELVYPVGEAIAGGLVMCCNQLSGILGVLIANALMQNHPESKYATNIMGIILFLISLIAIWMINERLARTEKEKEDKQQKAYQRG